MKFIWIWIYHVWICHAILTPFSGRVWSRLSTIIDRVWSRPRRRSISVYCQIVTFVEKYWHVLFTSTTGFKEIFHIFECYTRWTNELPIFTLWLYYRAVRDVCYILKLFQTQKLPLHEHTFCTYVRKNVQLVPVSDSRELYASDAFLITRMRTGSRLNRYGWRVWQLPFLFKIMNVKLVTSPFL